MPLPPDDARSVDWPPASERDALDCYRLHGAWYSGDPAELATVYADMPGVGGYSSDAELPRGQVPAPRFIAGIQRGLQRMFWGNPASVGQFRAQKLHVPLAGDIASASADLLYGEFPTFKIGEVGAKAAADTVATPNATQARLDEILEATNAEAVLMEAAEIGSAYGGAYVRIRWDPVIAETPLWDAIPPDAAVPEWRGTRLVAVTFWRELDRVDGKWWRHLERHEPGSLLNKTQKGRILHALYMSGDENKLGRRMALQDHPATAQFALLVDAADHESIDTGSNGMTAEYIPNMRPHRTMRGSPLGRSDYAGIEPIMDALDESWSSWMRDLRLGKGRLIVPRTYLQGQGRGKGATFDPEREIFETVDALTSPDSGLAMQIVQFQIRVAEHSQTCQELAVQAMRGAGYSAQTFGEGGDEGAPQQTATEVTARENMSLRTRAKKILYHRGPIARLTRTTLDVDVAKFGTKGITPDLPTVSWPDGVATDPQVQAQTLQLLAAAEAASIETRVRLLNPDWGDTQVKEEVDRIKADAAVAAPQVPPPGTGPAGGNRGGPGGSAAGRPPAASNSGSNGNARPAK